ncbi:MAG: PaaI family thioesterase [Hyphomonadaceae bacterium]
MAGDSDAMDDDTKTDGAADWPGNSFASRMVEYTPYAVALGMTYVTSSPGRGTILLPWRADLVGQDGTDILAPGILTALIDHTCGLAIMAGLGFEAAPATLDLRIDHMRPAAPRASITCSAHAYRATRTIAFLRAEAWDVSPDNPVATAQAAFTLNRREAK